jgi:hypothetical protein
MLLCEVRRDNRRRYIPPKLNHDKSNVKNSENTALFLVSCFEYILSGAVLNIGPPFRQRMTQNGTPTLHSSLEMDTINSPDSPLYGHYYLLATTYYVHDPWACIFDKEAYAINEDQLGLRAIHDWAWGRILCICIHSTKLCIRLAS